MRKLIKNNRRLTSDGWSRSQTWLSALSMFISDEMQTFKFLQNEYTKAFSWFIHQCFPLRKATCILLSYWFCAHVFASTRYSAKNSTGRESVLVHRCTYARMSLLFQPVSRCDASRPRFIRKENEGERNTTSPERIEANERAIDSIDRHIYKYRWRRYITWNGRGLKEITTNERERTKNEREKENKGWCQ